MNPQTLILHHDDTDGRCAAWCVLQHYPDAECVAVNYGDEPPIELATDRDVWIVDFSWPLEGLEALAEAANLLAVVDHHKTARADLETFACAYGLLLTGRDAWSVDTSGAYVVVHFDLERSGAGLTWDVLNPGKARPWFVDYVEDRDLWRWALANTKAVNAYLSTLTGGPESFGGWFTPDSRDKYKDGAPHLVLTCGAAVLRYQRKMIDRIVKNAGVMKIAEYTVPSVNSPVLQSELGNELAQGALFAAVWYEAPDGSHRISLRSTGDGLDVGEIAKRLGGGGHKHAARFTG